MASIIVPAIMVPAMLVPFVAAVARISADIIGRRWVDGLNDDGGGRIALDNHGLWRIALDNHGRRRCVDWERCRSRANEAADDTADDPAENCRASIVPMGEGMQGQR
jgi:hypothetical protein